MVLKLKQPRLRLFQYGHPDGTPEVEARIQRVTIRALK